jgi:hypothetical protein
MIHASISGFVLSTNVLNATQGLRLYLSLYRAVHGEGHVCHSQVPREGGSASCKHTDIFQDILAKVKIYASLNPGNCENGEAFNIAER